ncbi:uncharacterized protein LOC109727362 isoform X2 [Ananas comosus]|uniref:Uncharacterized protein LOC109727362 isoform X2 n=1 Tax=Ananas comosus TaxID=4615 RepID=A0A6P5GWN4_ANACO|nr:uncharacterized protein LOC109727362 isoform X2 [Ananas comosus]
MATIANTVVPIADLRLSASSCYSRRQSAHYFVNRSPVIVAFSSTLQRKVKFASPKRVVVQAAYSDVGKPSNASIFVGGFVLGGVVAGLLGCAYAPQISSALAGADRKDLMRKLPQFIYDEEKALETRKVLHAKIAQLISTIDGVSSKLRTNDGPNGMALQPDEIESAM